VYLNSGLLRSSCSASFAPSKSVTRSLLVCKTCCVCVCVCVCVVSITQCYGRSSCHLLPLSPFLFSYLPHMTELLAESHFDGAIRSSNISGCLRFRCDVSSGTHLERGNKREASQHTYQQHWSRSKTTSLGIAIVLIFWQPGRCLQRRCRRPVLKRSLQWIQ
jgi:hypothetical protein